MHTPWARFSKHEPGIPPYCPIALLRPGYLAPGTRYPDRHRGPDTEHRGPSPGTRKTRTSGLPYCRIAESPQPPQDFTTTWPFMPL
jgi:hypothetical protein